MGSAVTMVDELLTQAAAMTASDLHLEPVATGLRVRYRCDGMLYDAMTILSDDAPAVIARIKILAKLDIAQKRIPQDGKFVLQRPHGVVDLRVATFPTLYGEKIVIRLLDSSSALRGLTALGLSDAVRQQLAELIARSHGFFVVTGPTGSGKTTTLYALLTRIATPDKHVMTLEDPIEYTIIGTTQSQVVPEIGFDFACGMRAILRQDPDIIMVGEMRDHETAKTAFQAALTGHLVLSTLHTHDAPSAIVRLLDMGIPPFLINGVLTGVLAQRLVRLLCRSCAQEAPFTPAQQEYAQKQGMALEGSFEARGCTTCQGSGYQGRVGIFELLLMAPALQALVHEGASYQELALAARQGGMVNLALDAAAKVQAGLTSMAEVMRVLH